MWCFVNVTHSCEDLSSDWWACASTLTLCILKLHIALWLELHSSLQQNNSCIGMTPDPSSSREGSGLPDYTPCVVKWWSLIRMLISHNLICAQDPDILMYKISLDCFITEEVGHGWPLTITSLIKQSISAMVKIFRHSLGEVWTQHLGFSGEVIDLQSSTASFIDQNVN